MGFRMIHNNYNVSNLDESLAFYKEALGMSEIRRHNGDGFVIAFLSDGQSGHELELTEMADHPQKYDLGENEIHLAFEAEDYDAAHAAHEAMGCICYENPAMGIYFIIDPDGYWLEIVPKK